MRRDELYVLDIIESADLIINWLAGMSVDAWDADEKTRRAVLQLLTTIGEGARAIDVSMTPATASVAPAHPRAARGCRGRR